MGNKAKQKIYRKIFFSTLYLSTFTFGGGYVIITLLKRQFVDKLRWIDEEEMLDMVAIAQSAPGAIAVNGAIVVGYKLGNIPGVMVAVLGAVIPPFVILTIVSVFYTMLQNNLHFQAILKGMKSGVCAIILSTVYDMVTGVIKTKDIVSIVVMIGAFLVSYFGKINVVFIILATAVLGVIRTVLRARKERGEL